MGVGCGAYGGQLSDRKPTSDRRRNIRMDLAQKRQSSKTRRSARLKRFFALLNFFSERGRPLPRSGGIPGPGAAPPTPPAPPARPRGGAFKHIKGCFIQNV